MTLSTVLHKEFSVLGHGIIGSQCENNRMKSEWGLGSRPLGAWNRLEQRRISKLRILRRVEFIKNDSNKSLKMAKGSYQSTFRDAKILI